MAVGVDRAALVRGQTPTETPRRPPIRLAPPIIPRSTRTQPTHPHPEAQRLAHPRCDDGEDVGDHGQQPGTALRDRRAATPPPEHDAPPHPELVVGRVAAHFLAQAPRAGSGRDIAATNTKITKDRG